MLKRWPTKYEKKKLLIQWKYILIMVKFVGIIGITSDTTPTPIA